LSIRDSVLDELEMLAEPGAQLEYEKSLTRAGHAPTELVSVFCDDLYDPKNEAFISAFSRDEHKELAHLYGLLVEVTDSNYSSVPDMLTDPKWRRVVEVAQKLTSRFKSAR
jgi:hypothetical protein